MKRIVQQMSDGSFRFKQKDVSPDFKQKIQKAKMNYIKKKNLGTQAAKNLKWVDGKLFYNNKNTGFTVEKLLKDASPIEKGMGIIEKIESRIKRQGGGRIFSSDQMSEIINNLKLLKTALSRKDKNNASKILSRTTRILINQRAISKKDPERIKKITQMLQGLKILEKEVSQIQDTKI